MDDQTNAFRSLLVQLLDADNNIRSDGEKKYDEIPSPVRARLLLSIACTESQNVELKSLAIVLFRRLLTTDFAAISSGLPPESINQMKSDLLTLIKIPSDTLIKRKICDATAELAKNLIDENGENLWPEFLQFLFECVNSNDPILKECALNMFAYLPGAFGNKQALYMELIRNMLVHCLIESPACNLNVRTAAVKAMSCFVIAHVDEKPVVKQLQDTIGPCIALIASTLLLEGDHCDTALSSLVDLAEKCPHILRPQFDPLIQLCVKAVSEKSVPEERRHSALEIIISLAEAIPATVRKRGAPYLNSIVTQLLIMMTEFDDDEDWGQVDTVEDDDFESEAVIGETSLDRLACSVGGKTILPLVIGNVTNMLKNPDFKYRVAALMALSAIGEGCIQQMTPLLSDVVDGILPYLRDSHPRVRYAACNALGQMATDFSDSFQKKFHAKVVPALLELLDDSQNPRVQGHAGAALVNFLEECSSNLIADYQDAIAGKLEQLIKVKLNELSSQGTKLVLEQMVVTLASLADAAQENFMKHYETFVPLLKFIIQNAIDDKLKILRGKAIESISLIGLAVGRDKFAPDATEVMNLLLAHQSGQEKLADDDPQLAYMISAWARICKILGPAFEPYLPFVMGPVLKAAGIKIEVAILDKDDVNVVNEEEDWTCVNLGDQQSFGIKTTGLEEKATACQMLVCYARELKGAFVNYVKETLEIMVPLLKFYFHDDVRVAAAESFPYLLEAAKPNGDAFLGEMWRYFAPELIKATEIEPDRDVLCEMFSSLSSCIEMLGKQFISPDQLNEIVRVLDVHLKEHFQRAAERLEKRNDEDFDEGVEEILEDENDEDVYILSKVSDILRSCFIVFKEEFLILFDKIVHHFKNLAAPDRSTSEHMWAICVFDDVIQYTGPACVCYKDTFIPLISEGLTSQHAEIRQPSSYGWGVLAQYGGDQFASLCAEVLPVLRAIVEEPSSRSPDNINATENAISATCKILRYNHSCVNVNEVLAVWLKWLPIYEDEEELPEVYGFLLFLLESNHPVVLGENNCNLPSIVAIFAEVLARNAIDVNNPTGLRMVAFLKSLQQNPNLLNSCASTLTLAQQQALSQALTSQ